MAFHYRERQSREPWAVPVTWLRFYVRRFFRIAPLYYLFLTPAFALSPLLISMKQDIESEFPLPWASFLGLDPSLRDIIVTNVFLHLTFLFGLLPAYAANNPLPDWSLGREMQFYAVFPFIMLFMERFRYGLLILICSLLFVSSWHMIGVYITAEPRLLGVMPQPSLLGLKINCFLIGILIAEAYCKRGEGVSVHLMIAAVALAFYKQEAL
jgi:peptidoglycan/LPS O-acetylase OafA/YrhL